MSVLSYTVADLEATADLLLLLTAAFLLRNDKTSTPLSELSDKPLKHASKLRAAARDLRIWEKKWWSHLNETSQVGPKEDRLPGFDEIGTPLNLQRIRNEISTIKNLLYVDELLGDQEKKQWNNFVTFKDYRGAGDIRPVLDKISAKLESKGTILDVCIEAIVFWVAAINDLAPVNRKVPRWQSNSSSAEVDRINGEMSDISYKVMMKLKDWSTDEKPQALVLCTSNGIELPDLDFSSVVCRGYDKLHRKMFKVTAFGPSFEIQKVTDAAGLNFVDTGSRIRQQFPLSALSDVILGPSRGPRSNDRNLSYAERMVFAFRFVVSARVLWSSPIVSSFRAAYIRCINFPNGTNRYPVWIYGKEDSATPDRPPNRPLLKIGLLLAELALAEVMELVELDSPPRKDGMNVHDYNPRFLLFKALTRSEIQQHYSHLTLLEAVGAATSTRYMQAVEHCLNEDRAYHRHERPWLSSYFTSSEHHMSFVENVCQPLYIHYLLEQDRRST